MPAIASLIIILYILEKSRNFFVYVPVLITDENCMTTRPGVFAAGDVVRAVEEAKRAAKAMMNYMEKENGSHRRRQGTPPAAQAARGRSHLFLFAGFFSLPFFNGQILWAAPSTNTARRPRSRSSTTRSARRPTPIFPASSPTASAGAVEAA